MKTIEDHLKEKGIQYDSFISLADYTAVCEAVKTYALEYATEQLKKLDDCPLCKVPIDLHGTSCGWVNAKIECSPDGIVTDKRHPKFGLHFQSK